MQARSGPDSQVQRRVAFCRRHQEGLPVCPCHRGGHCAGAADRFDSVETFSKALRERVAGREDTIIFPSRRRGPLLLGGLGILLGGVFVAREAGILDGRWKKTLLWFPSRSLAYTRSPGNRGCRSFKEAAVLEDEPSSDAPEPAPHRAVNFTRTGNRLHCFDSAQSAH